MGTERPNIFNEPDREAHRKKRRVIGFGISERAMRVFEPEMAQEVDVFLGQLLRSGQNQEIVDMTPSCERLGVDIIGQLAFGFQLNSQRDPTHRPVSAGMRARSRLGSLYMAWPALRYMDPIITRLSPVKYNDDMQSLYKSLRTMIGARMALPKDAKPDFYAHVSGDIAPGDPGLDTKDLWAEAILIVAAGIKSLILTPHPPQDHRLTLSHDSQVGAPLQRPSQQPSSIFHGTPRFTSVWHPRSETVSLQEKILNKVHSSAHAATYAL